MSTLTDNTCPSCTRYRVSSAPHAPFVARTPKHTNAFTNRCESCLDLPNVTSPPSLSTIWGTVALYESATP